MATTFEERLTKRTDLFIPFIMAGDPHPDVSIDLALALQEAGADVLELGVPYSDPLADGPTIQESAKRALSHGMSLIKAMELVPLMRERGLKIPVLIFTYYNPVLQLGEKRFFALLRENDLDGMLIPDLPFEESGDLRTQANEEGLAFISLVAPTSKERIEKIATEARSGFLYCVSSLGVTGVRSQFHDGIYAFLKDVKSFSKIPVAVGFGISSNEQIKQLKDHCDGFIVGSAIIKEVENLQEQLLDESSREEALINFKKKVASILSSNE
jgi:tryptophan synthase alpha chain